MMNKQETEKHKDDDESFRSMRLEGFDTRKLSRDRWLFRTRFLMCGHERERCTNRGSSRYARLISRRSRRAGELMCYIPQIKGL